MDPTLTKALSAADNQTPADNGGQQKADPPEKAPKTMSDLARVAAGGSEPPARKAEPQNEGDGGAPEDFQFPDHEIFKALKKPEKGAPQGEHIRYAKEVGKAWQRYSDVLVGEKTNLSKTLEERAKEIEAERRRAKEAEGKLSAMSELEGRATKAEARLAVLDLQHDPTFRRKYLEPIAAKEQSVGTILKLAGAREHHLVAAISDAMGKESDTEFYGSVIEAMRGVIPDAMQASAINDLRDLRGLYQQRNNALRSAPDAGKLLEKERAEETVRRAESWMNRDFKALQDDVRLQASGLRLVLQEPEVQDLISPHKGVLDEMDANFPVMIRRAAEKYGELPTDVVSYAILGRELMPSLFVMSAMIKDHARMKAELEEAKKALDVELSRRGGGSGGGEPRRQDGPRSMAELAKQLGQG